MIDFSYNGERLSDYGCIVVSINTAFSDSVQASTITFDTIKIRGNFSNNIINTRYDDVISATFDICKNPCLFSEEKMEFSDGEISYFMRWLNQKEYYKFKPIYENDQYSDLYFYGTFSSISLITISGKVYGFTLTFTANSPFGYVDDKEYNTSILETNGNFIFYDDSDEIGILHPYFFKVECLDSGDLKISNDRYSDYTLIKNCKNGEILTMDCINKIIQSNLSHPSLYNDFNYNYPKIINNLSSRKNIFTVSIPCNITIQYAPIRKAGIMV